MDLKETILIIDFCDEHGFSLDALKGGDGKYVALTYCAADGVDGEAPYAVHGLRVENGQVRARSVSTHTIPAVANQRFSEEKADSGD